MTAANKDRIWTLLTRKLAAEATPAELNELETLLLIHPETASSIHAITDFWHTHNEHDEEFLEATYLLHLDRMKKKGYDISKTESEKAHMMSGGGIPRKYQLARLAVLFVFILIITATVFFKTNKGTVVAAQPVKGFKSEVSTKNGSRTRLVLPDGSVVWLNAGSKLNYDKNFGTTLREVKLSGEGFFDVVRNPEKPFIIYTETVDIKVLGTQFNVRSYPGDKTTETSLIRGSVEVTLKGRSNEKYILKPNEKIVVLNKIPLPQEQPALVFHEPIVAIKSLSYLNGEQTAVEALWTKNKLSFQDETFSEIVDKMKRWYDVSFEFRNHDREEIRFTGSFNNETLQEALEAMKFTSAFHYEIRDKLVIIY